MLIFIQLNIIQQTALLNTQMKLIYQFNMNLVKILNKQRLIMTLL